jgi:hypothetical protein
MSKFIIVLLSIFISSGAFAANQDTQPADSETAKEDATSTEEEELICTRVPVTGSHMKVKTCRTKAQAEDERVRSRAYIDRLRSQPITEGSKG